MSGRHRHSQVTVLPGPDSRSSLLALDVRTVIVIVALAVAVTALIANALMGEGAGPRAAGRAGQARTVPMQSLTPAPPPG